MPESTGPAAPDAAERTAAHPRDAAASSARILEAARAEFCEWGLSGARIDRIAAAADINKRMLYHYYGNKDALYRATLVDAYQEIRAGERSLDLDRYPPGEAMARLVRFTFRHFLEKPWFVRLLTVENLHQARFLKTVEDIRALHSPLVAEIQHLLTRGARTGRFREGIDPVQLYISIAALGFFYVSNTHTLSTIFGRDLGEPAALDEREAHIVAMIDRFLTPVPDAPAP
jgi:AcrR family transcriptional regulator